MGGSRIRRGGALLLLACCASAAAQTAAAAPAAQAPFRMAALPPILEFVNGTPVTTPEQWQARRAEISALLQGFFYGTFPPPASVPPILAAAVLNSTSATTNGDFEISWVNVTYATPLFPASTLSEVIRPSFCTPSSPCPVSMASSEHRRWLLAHAARGYVAVSFHSGDNSCNDAECNLVDPTACWAQNFPDATFQLIGRRAFYASRVLDYVLTLPFVRPGAVGITGHSRNGKQALIAAGMDERFGAVVDSSSGAAGIGAYRIMGGDAQGESPGSAWPGPWFLPALRSFDGREDELPIDAHAVAGLIAPRPLLLAHAVNDQVISTYAVEASLGEALKAYAFAGAPQAVKVDYRIGDHHGWEAPERYADFYDTAFGWSNPRTCGARCAAAAAASEAAAVVAVAAGAGDVGGGGGTGGGFGGVPPAPPPPHRAEGRGPLSAAPYGPSHWPMDASVLFHSFNWSAWDAAQGYPPASGPPLPPPGATSAERVAWLLGDEPSFAPIPDPGGSYPPPSDLTYVDALQGHDLQSGGLGGLITRLNVGFGPGLTGNLYFRSDMLTRSPGGDNSSDGGGGTGGAGGTGGGGWPAVVWVHSPANYQKGYVASYPVDPLSIYHALANASCVVLAFESAGRGVRLSEGVRQFYDRFPTWSLLGKMVADVLSGVDLLASPQLGQEGAFFPSGWPDAIVGMPRVDPSRVFAAGYGLGGLAALIAAGKDARIAGVATVSGWTPFRTDTDASPGGGVRRWWGWHGTSPRLGWFAGGGREALIPVEADDILSLVRPRPVLAFVAAQDRACNATAVGAVVSALRAGGYGNLTLASPPGISALDAQATGAVVAWMQVQWGAAS